MSTTILSATVLTPLGGETSPTTVMSASFTWALNTVVQTVAVNGNVSPNRPVVIKLQLSPDNVNWTDVDRRIGPAGAGDTGYQIFRLADYAGNCGSFAANG